MNEIDIVFTTRTDVEWYYGTGTVPFAEFDFKSVALHELGHALQLGHIINPNAAMHYSISNGASSYNLTQNEIDGALHTTARFFGGDLCGSDPMVAAKFIYSPPM